MDAGVICPWTIYQVYGDLEVVENNWQSMEIFMEFRLQRDRQMIGQDEGKTWGDWLNLDQPTPLPYIDLCYYAYSSSLMADMAEALGKTDRAKHFRGLREKIGNSFASLYLEGNGKLKVQTQTAYALALFMDLIPENQKTAAGEHLAELVYEKGGRMATGFLGTRHLLPALTKSGQHALAGKLMQSTEYPSWGYEVVNGATSIWERWNSYIKGKGSSNERMNSFSHYAFGAVGEWMFQNLVGISTLDPGWKSFRIAPNPVGDLTWVKGSFDSPQGPIHVSWEKKENGAMQLAVTVPPNTTAQLELPTDDLKVSGKPVSKVDGVELVSFSEGKGVYQVRSGSYKFHIPKN
jgi:alpha-L-rhamnosidase